MKTNQHAKPLTGAQIRQSFIDFFIAHQHTFVPSAPLVPGGDQTLLFTNAGMVQFKDVFLGTDKRSYTRAVNSQKCMRVAGKHNDLDDVGRDDTHHTFFEMLGNWSFGDYYKKEAIAWAWELLTEVWGLPKDKLWATCFKDEKGEIPTDEEAANYWLEQKGMDPSHVLFFGRKDNFWEMAETGPCGPCSEIHIDRGPEACNKQHEPGHVCRVNGDCARFLELWNLVFIQYNRLSQSELELLPAKHVDTGMGLERIVSILQGTSSNYKTDLLSPIMAAIQRLTKHTDEERTRFITPYRVITDHARAAAFLIADGVVPGNIGRNYVCRMIVRRAARFGTKIGLNDPFLAKVADTVIDTYGDFYQELRQNRTAILDSLTREEEQFHRTLESGLSRLEQVLERAQIKNEKVISGKVVFDLYATYGLPLELVKDIAEEQGLAIEEAGFHQAMEEHRIASGAGAFGDMDATKVETYRQVFDDLVAQGALSVEGVRYNPYSSLRFPSKIVAMIKNSKSVVEVKEGDTVEVLLPETSFYLEAGGQVSDTGVIYSEKKGWKILVENMRKPAAGVIVHYGKVLAGNPQVGDDAIAEVDYKRRKSIERNHTATHLLHAALREIIGPHARQAGSLVAPDHLRFDFTHPQALTQEELDQVEQKVNEQILKGYPLKVEIKPLEQARAEGAMALFGEKYADVVRTIAIGDDTPLSYELCGGTHVEETSDIGIFIITSEGSAAAGIRRIEAITGYKAYQYVQQMRHTLRSVSKMMGTTADLLLDKTKATLEELAEVKKDVQQLQQQFALLQLEDALEKPSLVNDIHVLTATIENVEVDVLRMLADRFRQKYPQKSVAVLGSVSNGSPIIVASLTEDLVKQGYHAGDLAKAVAKPLGGSGGGRPTLAQAGGKDASKLKEAIHLTLEWVKAKQAG